MGTDTPTPTAPQVVEFDFDPDEHPWVRDHCPTYVLPALPMTYLAELLADAANTAQSGFHVVGLRDVRAFRWLICDRPRKLRTESMISTHDEIKVRLLADTPGRGNGWELIATGSVQLSESWPLSPPSPPSLEAGVDQPSPYRSGQLFHGLAFQYLTSLRMGSRGSSYTLDPSAGSVFTGRLNPGLLDATTHGIPHDALGQWCPEVGTGVASYPLSIREIRFYGPPPTDRPICCEARFHSKVGSAPARVLINIAMIDGERLWGELVLEEVCLPMGPLGRSKPEDRVAFLRDNRYVPGVTLSRFEGQTTILHRASVAESDWLPGTMAAVFDTRPESDLCRQIAVKEHVAHAQKVHPSLVSWREGESHALLRKALFPLHVEDDGEYVRVQSR